MAETYGEQADNEEISEDAFTAGFMPQFEYFTRVGTCLGLARLLENIPRQEVTNLYSIATKLEACEKGQRVGGTFSQLAESNPILKSAVENLNLQF